MSYARWGTCDVYVWMASGGGVICCGRINAKEVCDWTRLESDEDVRNHFQRHREAGHNVPEDLEDDIIEDVADCGGWEHVNDPA